MQNIDRDSCGSFQESSSAESPRAVAASQERSSDEPLHQPDSSLTSSQRHQNMSSPPHQHHQNTLSTPPQRHQGTSSASSHLHEDTVSSTPSQRHQDTSSTFQHHQASTSQQGEADAHTVSSPHPELPPPSDPDVSVPDEHETSQPHLAIAFERRKKMAFLMVGLVFMLSSAAHWTNVAIVNRYTHLSTLREFIGNASGDILSLIGVNSNLNVLCQPGNTTPAAVRQNVTEAEETTSNTLLFLSLCCDLPALFTTIVLGAYSDIMGRRLLFGLPVLGLLLGNAVTAAVLAFGWEPRWLFLGSFAEGIFGGFGGVRLACFTYAVDIAKVGGKRTRALAGVQTMMGVALLITHVLIGYSVQTVWMLYPAVVSTVPPFITLLLVVFFLREMADLSIHSSPVADHRARSLVKNMCKRVKHFYIQPNTTSASRMRLLLGVAAFSFLVLPSKARFRLLFMYSVNAPLCWTPLLMGLYRAFSDGCQHALGYGFILLLQRVARDEAMAVVGLVSLVVTDTWIAFAHTTEMMFAAAAAGLAGAMSNPVLRSVMSQLVSPQGLGTLFANLAVFESVIGLVGQTLYFMYRNTVESMRGAVFLVIASIRAISILFALGLAYKSRGHHCHTISETCVGESRASDIFDQSNASNHSIVREHRDPDDIQAEEHSYAVLTHSLID